jgi:hypothetical protein
MTVFRFSIDNDTFLKEYKKRGASTFETPNGFRDIKHFANSCKEHPALKTAVSFSCEEYVPLNLGDEVLINCIYYKVVSKTFVFASDKLIYDLMPQ